MKKLLLTLLFMFVTYVIYYDLSAGVLSTPTSIVLLQGKEESKHKNKPSLQEEKKENKNDATLKTGKEEQLDFKEVKVASGQTVLSIAEQLQGGPLPVSISQLIEDFQILNPKIEPEMIQIGRVYKFPVYNETE